MPGPDRKRRLTTLAIAVVVLIATPLAVVASHQFNDVPDSNIFHDDIEWLADNDVTRGCNPPANDEFCPEDNVTRQQMAAFMHRLAENEVVAAATANEADNADMLDGQDSTAYATAVAFFECGFADSSTTNCSVAAVDQTNGTLVGEISLEVPASGATELTGSVSAATTGSTQFAVWITHDASCANTGDTIVAQAINGKVAVTSAQGAVETLDVSVIEAVPAGVEIYRLCTFQFGSPGAQPLWAANLFGRWTAASPSVITSSSGTVTNHGEGGLGG